MPCKSRLKICKPAVSLWSFV